MAYTPPPFFSENRTSQSSFQHFHLSSRSSSSSSSSSSALHTIVHGIASSDSMSKMYPRAFGLGGALIRGYFAASPASKALFGNDLAGTPSFKFNPRGTSSPLSLESLSSP